MYADLGTYPFVTSSNTGVGGVLTGLSLGWRSIHEVIGVVLVFSRRHVLQVIIAYRNIARLIPQGLEVAHSQPNN